MKLKHDYKKVEVTTYQRRRSPMVALVLSGGHSTMLCALTPNEAQSLAKALINAARKEAENG